MQTRYFITFCILLIFLASCSRKNSEPNNSIIDEIEIPDGFVYHEIELIDDIGNIKIALPQNFDTTYQWINYSDFCYCDRQMYRIADHRYSLLKETGMIYNGPFQDSLWQFTISHQIFPCVNFYYSDLKDSLINFKYISDGNIVDEILINQTQTINNRKFNIVAIKRPRWNSNQTMILIFVKTVINAICIELQFTCSAINWEEFEELAIGSLNTIVINENELSYKTVLLALRNN